MASWGASASLQNAVTLLDYQPTRLHQPPDRSLSEPGALVTEGACISLTQENDNKLRPAVNYLVD